MAVTSAWVSGIGDAKYKSIKTASNASDNDSLRAFSATGGSEVKTVGGFKYHMFDATSSFVVSAGSKACEILVIGAGGGGGRYIGGGGGAGAKEPASGYTTQTLSANSYTVTVAAGGAGQKVTNANKGDTALDTSFSGIPTITAKGGGGGASGGNVAGANGGSGGGGSGNSANSSGGTATGSNTNAGGTGFGGNLNYGSGGGGGASGVGGNGTNTTGGNGGAGLTLTNIDANLISANFTTLTGMTVICSGGGGSTYNGGTAGTGGTGAGNGTNNNNAGGNATSFGSGGGGGGGTNNPGGNGGDGFKGLVIVRYAV